MIIKKRKGIVVSSELIKCIYCKNDKVVKFGKNPKGKQRFKCKSCNKTFQINYFNNGAKIETKIAIVQMYDEGYGIRKIARILDISTNTVNKILKNQKSL